MDENQKQREKKLCEEVSHLSEGQIPQFLQVQETKDILVCSGVIVKRFFKLAPSQLTLIDKIFHRFNRQLIKLDTARCQKQKLKQQLRILSQREQKKQITIRQLEEKITKLMQKIQRLNQINQLLTINNHQLTFDEEAPLHRNQHCQVRLQGFQQIDNDNYSFIHINFSSQGSDSSQQSPRFRIQKVVHLMFDPNNVPAEQQPEEQKSLNSSLCILYEDIWGESTVSYDDDLRIRSTHAPDEEVDRLGLVDGQALNYYHYPQQQQPPDDNNSPEDRN